MAKNLALRLTQKQTEQKFEAFLHIRCRTIDSCYASQVTTPFISATFPSRHNTCEGDAGRSLDRRKGQAVQGITSLRHSNTLVADMKPTFE